MRQSTPERERERDVEDGTTQDWKQEKKKNPLKEFPEKICINRPVKERGMLVFGWG